jgi:hypothetical protein
MVKAYPKLSLEQQLSYQIGVVCGYAIVGASVLAALVAAVLSLKFWRIL